jgi:hypothetical protein
VSGFNWTLELQVEETTRLPKLQRLVPFDQIAEDIAAGMIVLCCHRSSIKDTAFSRVAYCVQVEKDLFDLFFNSANGYRAAYFRSLWEGMRANAAFLKTVAPKLLSSGPSSSCGLSEQFMRESLATPSAKVWLAEHGKEVERDCVACRGEWSTGSVGELDKPEIRNGRWDRAQTLKANWGSKAPYLTKLRILGAFLDERFNELVPWDKRFRAKEIHEFGWS